MSIKLKFGSVVLAIAVCVLAAPAWTSAQFFMMQNPLVGKKAPEFAVRDLDGVEQDFSKLTAGKNSLIFFWATWCPHCREQLWELHHKKAQIKADGIELVLVDLGENAQVVKTYFQKQGMNFPVLVDADGVVAEQYNVLGIPMFVYVDKTGTVSRVDNYLSKNYREMFTRDRN